MSPDPSTTGIHEEDPQTWNIYRYAENNPLKYVDLTGETSYLMARPIANDPAGPIGSFAVHMFVVTNARYYGDPDATVHSWGKSDSGMLGRVDNTTTNAESAGTAQSDRQAWLSTGYLLPQTGVYGTPIPASDAAVDDAASSLVEDQRYQPVPTLSGANSNGAASAVADRAAAAHVPIPGAGQRTPVGVGSSSRINFSGGVRPAGPTSVDRKIAAYKTRAAQGPVRPVNQKK